MKLCSIDLETTGFNPETCQILEFGAVIDDLENPLPIEKLPRFHAYVVNDMIIGEPFALNMNAKIIEKINKFLQDQKKGNHEGFNGTYYLTIDQLIPKFKEWLIYNNLTGKINAAGKNYASFDSKFLAKVKGFIDLKIAHRVIDPAILYYKVGDINLPDGKTCMERAGLAGEVSHTAVEDALMVCQLIRIGLGIKYESKD